MALNPFVFSSALAASAPFPGGPSFPLMTTAIGNAFTAWAPVPGNVILSGITSGVAGSGVVTGTIILPPNPALVVSIFSSFGIIGPTSSLLATAIAIGFSTAMSTVQYQGVSVGVSAGSDVSRIIPVNIPVLSALILANYPTPGVLTPVLAGAISTAVATLLTTATGIGVVVPLVPAPSPAAGTSISSMI